MLGKNIPQGAELGWKLRSLSSTLERAPKQFPIRATNLIWKPQKRKKSIQLYSRHAMWPSSHVNLLTHCIVVLLHHVLLPCFQRRTRKQRTKLWCCFVLLYMHMNPLTFVRIYRQGYTFWLELSLVSNATSCCQVYQHLFFLWYTHTKLFHVKVNMKAKMSPVDSQFL